jgi:Gluconate 2-dehydrogenase subunit 3
MTGKGNTNGRSGAANSSANQRLGIGTRKGTMSRREFLTNMNSSVAAVAVLGLVSPAGLAAADGHRSEKLRVFSKSEAATYAAWGEVLAIGAAKAGIAQFVDKYLAKPHPDSLLLLRLLQNPPFDSFYIGGIAGIDQESQARFSRPFLSLQVEQRNAVVNAAAASSTIAWTTPNPNLFYFVSRSDAVDVVYGTVKGFHKLDIPYLPHIRPPNPW